MKKIDEKKIKGISIQFDMSTKLNELDGAILKSEKKTDHKHEIGVSSILLRLNIRIMPKI